MSSKLYIILHNFGAFDIKLPHDGAFDIGQTGGTGGHMRTESHLKNPAKKIRQTIVDF